MSSDDTPDATVEVRIPSGRQPGRKSVHAPGRKPRAADGRERETVNSEGPERKCILTGAHGERAHLIRLARGPDGAAWPDVGARLPGRGAWIVADRELLEAARSKGRLKAALSRAFREPTEVPEDLAQKIADGLERRALDRLGLEHRAGHLIFGSDKLTEWARAGRLYLLMHAADAAEDGTGKLDQAWRSGGGDPAAPIRLPVGRDALSRALGRENIVHSGVIDGKAAARIATDVARWAAFTGKTIENSDGRAVPGRRNDEGRE